MLHGETFHKFARQMHLFNRSQYLPILAYYSKECSLRVSANKKLHCRQTSKESLPILSISEVPKSWNGKGRYEKTHWPSLFLSLSISKA